MDVVNVLQTPPIFFRLFIKLALSLFSSTFNLNYKAIPERRQQSSYDIDPRTGFFPPKPLQRLPSGYSIWEDALRAANGNLSLGEDDSEEALSKRAFGERWRSNIASWPVLDCTPLQTDLRSCQRAHMVLAWLVNFYVHSMPRPQGTPALVPKSLAVPLTQISRHLAMAPVLTFADTVLWNWELVNPAEPLSMDNIRFVNLFSGTDDERNFYQSSARAELRGVEILRIIDDYTSHPNIRDLTAISKVARDLTRLSGIVDSISEIIQSVRPNCDPHVFYWDIRPWFEGSDAKGPTEPGWIYEGVDVSEPLDLSGPSAGQSSVMHALDIFLDIDHKLGQRRYPAPSSENKRADLGFMERMRRYMPGKHQDYLRQLSSISLTVREVARSTPALRDPYDNAVTALKRLRDQHIRIACLYIVTMSRSTPGSRAGCPASAMIERLQAARASGKGPVRGTGGNELSVLLKAGRDATRRAILKSN
ncbi:Indoleamine 2,3-dioxygenase 1 [Psilocybe cubensis]|uniref:Indoleamine 2,3-dioxygenase 1 n=2 Tax=Psilocybe cubensis TaxID=181762 RepID=A0ACB8H8H5_PSICU|nr:Indoleamine 2,3-dioxygenase 1 [Psilocybe cubensis]KAH9483962.1 Indoleamine 2,3-dioxygenase 1 [Psilocybe cubensis]